MRLVPNSLAGRRHQRGRVEKILLAPPEELACLVVRERELPRSGVVLATAAPGGASEVKSISYVSLSSLCFAQTAQRLLSVAYVATAGDWAQSASSATPGSAAVNSSASPYAHQRYHTLRTRVRAPT